MVPDDEVSAEELRSAPAPEESAPQLDPAEWEAAADRAAEELRKQIEQLSTLYSVPDLNPSFRQFWNSVRELNERIRLAPAIKLDDKFELQRNLNHLCESVRHEQKTARDLAEARRNELQEALNLIIESLAEATTVAEIQDVRSDLTVLRERINSDTAIVGRGARQDLWSGWQAANAEAWHRLNSLWEQNGIQLGIMLDAAQTALAKGEHSQARQHIKTFHTSATTHPTAHRTLRDLQTRAGKLWQEAEEVGRKKHEAYLSNAGRRVRHWRARQSENARTRRSLERQIEDLQRQAATTSSDVGAALLRGQLAERQKTLSRLATEDRELEERIKRAEQALARG